MGSLVVDIGLDGQDGNLWRKTGHILPGMNFPPPIDKLPGIGYLQIGERR